jgi:hypothetical protein
MKVRENQEGLELNEIKQRIVYDDDGNLMRENKYHNKETILDTNKKVA